MLFSTIPTMTHNVPAINKRVLLETPGFHLSILLLLENGFIRMKMVGQAPPYTFFVMCSNRPPSLMMSRAKSGSGLKLISVPAVLFWMTPVL
jgi:hypothetical protein